MTCNSSEIQISLFILGRFVKKLRDAGDAEVALELLDLEADEVLLAESLKNLDHLDRQLD